MRQSIENASGETVTFGPILPTSIGVGLEMIKSPLNRPIAILLTSLILADFSAQLPVESEVRQIVTFSFPPGKSGEALAVFRDVAIPLYERDDAMLSFRGFREVESPIALDLIVVSSFAGMSGMDESNSMLGTLAAEAGTSIGAIYGRIGALSSRHTDEFVEMLPALGNGDPNSPCLVPDPPRAGRRLRNRHGDDDRTVGGVVRHPLGDRPLSRIRRLELPAVPGLRFAG